MNLCSDLVVGTQMQCNIQYSRAKQVQLHCIEECQHYAILLCNTLVGAAVRIICMHMQQTAWNPRNFLFSWPGATSTAGTHHSSRLVLLI